MSAQPANAATTPLAPTPAFHSGFESPADLTAAQCEGDVQIAASRPWKGGGWLKVARAREHMESHPACVMLPHFAVREGRWDLSVALRSALHSPDSSYNGTVWFETFDADGAPQQRVEGALATGTGDWRVHRKCVELEHGAATARFVVRMEKTWGEFGVDELSATYAGPIPQAVAAIRFASNAVGNLFLPEDPLRFELTVECRRPLPSRCHRVVCRVRDYWGAEFSTPIEVPVVEAGRTDKGRFAYRGTLDLATASVETGKYHEVHADVPEPERAEPASDHSSFAVLPLAVTKRHAPFDVPFTASGWNPGVPGFFPLCDRLGIRVADVYSRWSAEPPYEVQAPGIGEVIGLGMGALMSTMAFMVEQRRKGYEAYDEKALFGGAKRLVETYKDRLPIAIRNGNEPHPADDAQALEMIACYKAIYEGVKAADPNVLVTSTSCGAEECFFRLGFQRYYDVYDFHQYADAGVIPGDFARYERLVAKYGMRKPVWSTEIGLNSQGMARSAVAIQMIKIFTTFFACGGENASWFGVMWPDPDATNVGSNGESFDVFDSRYCLYAPKLTAVTEYHIVNAICVKRFVETRTYDDGTVATLFRDRDNACLLVLWRDAGRKDLSVDLPGVRAVRAIRLDGGSSTLDAAGRGLTLTVSDEPYLLLFDSADLRLPATLGPARLAVAGEIPSVVKGTSARVAFELPDAHAASPRLRTPPGWTVAQESRDAGRLVVRITAPAHTAAREGRVLAELADGSGELLLALPVTDPVEVRFLPFARDAHGAGMRVTVRNHGREPLDVDWSFSAQETFPMSNGTFRLGEPQPFVPDFVTPDRGRFTLASKADASAEVRLRNVDGRSLYRAAIELSWDGGLARRERLFGGCVGVPRVAGGVLFDGQLGDPAWGRSPALALDDASQYAVLTRTTARRERPEDLSATMRLLWDDEFLYVGLCVQDDVFAAPECDANIWRGDGLQFLVDPCRSSDAKPGKYDYAIALGTKGPQAWCYSSADAARAPTEEVTDFRLKITPTGHRGDMVYEVALPWHRLSPFRPEPGANLGLAMIVNDDDGKIRDSFIAWFGCAHSKQMSMNGDLVLLA